MFDKTTVATKVAEASSNWHAEATRAWDGANNSVSARLDHFVQSTAPVIDFNLDHILTKNEILDGINGNYVPDAEKPVARFLADKMPELQNKFDPNVDGLRLYDLRMFSDLLHPNFSQAHSNYQKDIIYSMQGGFCGSLVGMALGGALSLKGIGNFDTNFKIGMAAGALVGGAIGHHMGNDAPKLEAKYQSLKEEGLKNTLEELKSLR